MFFSSSRNRSHNHSHSHSHKARNHQHSSKVHKTTKATPSSSHAAYTASSSSFRNNHPSNRVQRSSFIHQYPQNKHPPSSTTHANTSPSFPQHQDQYQHPNQNQDHNSLPTSPTLTSNIITLTLGPTARLFAAHEQVLVRSPYFANLLQQHQQHGSPSSTTSNARNRDVRINFPHISAEVFSCVLEYLYKGDYSPRLMWDGKGAWSLEQNQSDKGKKDDGLVWSSSAGGGRGEEEGGWVLKDTAIYCTALLFALPDLARLALKKHSLHQTPIQCSIILSSARYAYANTPDTDSRLRAHYLALIIRSRDVFKRSGTLQAEMGRGGGLWFDLFVAMVNHLDDVAASRGL